MLVILPDVIRHFKGPRMYKSNVKNMKSKNVNTAIDIFTNRKSNTNRTVRSNC